MLFSYNTAVEGLNHTVNKFNETLERVQQLYQGIHEAIENNLLDDLVELAEDVLHNPPLRPAGK